MKYLSILVCTLLLLYSCKSSQDRLKEKITPILRASVLKDSVVATIDSLIIYNIDTLTTLQDSLSKINRLINLMEYEQSQQKYLIEIAKIDQESVKLSLSQYRLYKSMFGPGELANSQADKAKSHLNKSKESLKEADLHAVSIDNYSARINNILKLQKEGKLDSVLFKGYIVTYRLKGADKDNNSIKKDSLQQMVNPDYRIISYSDINRK